MSTDHPVRWATTQREHLGL